jgi:hypothetical protein
MEKIVMRKKVISIFMSAMVLSFIMGCVESGPKYDGIVNTYAWKKLIEAYDKVLPQYPVLKNYLDAVVNVNRLKKICDSGRLDKNKVKFITTHQDDVIKILHASLAKILGESNIDANDAQFIYITGVLKDPHAQFAKNGPEYEVEKNLFHQMPLYKFAEIEGSEENIAKFLNALLDNYVNGKFK